MNPVRWLAVLPFVAILIGTAFFNTVEPLIFGIPFVLAWIVGWVILTSVVMAIIYVFDPVNAKVGAGDDGATP
jgi:hypothetical protein